MTEILFLLTALSRVLKAQRLEHFTLTRPALEERSLPGADGTNLSPLA